MSKSNTLFNLIKSLSQSEKRYFKVFCKQYSEEAKDPSYLELFDLVDKMEVYKEENLIKQIKNAQLATQLSVYKNYLYNLILKSLRNYYANQQAKIQLQEWLADVEILERKGLIPQALKRLDQAEKLACELHQDMDRLKIVDVKRKLIRQLGPKKSEPELEILHELSLYLLERIKLDLEVIDYYGKVLTALQSERGKKLSDRLAQAVQWLESKVELNQLSPRGQLAYHFMYAFYHRGRQEYKEAKYYYENLTQLFDFHVRMKEEYQQQYVGVISNYLGYCFISKDFAEVPILLHRLKDITPQNVIMRRNIQEYAYYFEFLFQIHRQDFKAAITEIPAIETFLDENKSFINIERQLSFYYNMAYAFLMEGTLALKNKQKFQILFSEALKKTVLIINEPAFNIRQDIKLMTKIYAAIIHLELDNESVTEFFLRSANYHFKKTAEQNAPEYLIINCLKQYLTAERRKRKAILEALDAQLIHAERTQHIKTWIQQRLQQPF